MSEPQGWDNAFTAKSPYGTVKGSPSYAGALSFMRRKYSRDLGGVDVAVTGIPLDTATTNRPGARFGPRAVRAASAGISWERPWPWDFDPFDRLAVVDYGDCEFDPGIPETIVPFIEEYFDRILDAGAASLAMFLTYFLSIIVKSLLVINNLECLQTIGKLRHTDLVKCGFDLGHEPQTNYHSIYYVVLVMIK